MSEIQQLKDCINSLNKGKKDMTDKLNQIEIDHIRTRKDAEGQSNRQG